ncbi:23S rRNA (pseudouridine(1915)-N(3))-methyltransferase RlmH [Candidatus Woesearchaeota archaeon]|nr:23S rRNA (pseudouridine(1915)-N(3))-methyltransferase RlmH [Candidatus Woesearchaeota archaeon]
MKLDIICVGKLKEKFTREWIEEYLKRLTKYCRIDVSEIKESTEAREGEELLKRVRDDDFVVVLDAHGKQFTSEQFANLLKEKTLERHVVFIVGGHTGLAMPVIKRANTILSFGEMTFTHQIARLLLLEQVYRAFTIIKGEPYHK